MSNKITLELTEREANVLSAVLAQCVWWKRVPEAQAIWAALDSGAGISGMGIPRLKCDRGTGMFALPPETPAECPECGK